jgi:hypothetical protein
MIWNTDTAVIASTPEGPQGLRSVFAMLDKLEECSAHAGMTFHLNYCALIPAYLNGGIGTLALVAEGLGGSCLQIDGLVMTGKGF